MNTLMQGSTVQRWVVESATQAGSVHWVFASVADARAMQRRLRSAGWSSSCGVREVQS